MPEGTLIVDTDNLTSVTIPAMTGYKTEIDDSYTTMQSIVQSLVDNGYMDSETATAYVDEFTTLLAPDVQALSTLVETYYTQLQQICTAFLEQDAEMAGQLG